MDTTITVRHCEISDALRARASTVIERVANLATRPQEATVVFGTDGDKQVVELRLHVAHGEIFVASGDGPDHRTALDRAEGKLRRQVEKAFGRFRSGRNSPAQRM